MAKLDVPFTIHETGDTTGEIFAGSFRCKIRLSHRDHLNRDALRRQFIGPNPDGAQERTIVTSEMASQCAVRITDAPSWWKASDNGLTLEDDNVLAAVYNGAIKAANEYEEEQAKRAKEAKGGLSEMKPPVD